MDTYYQSLIESILDPVGSTKKDVIYRCPFCESSNGSGHLYINYDKNVFHCYKCDIGGRDIGKLLRMMGYTDFEEIPDYIKKTPRTSILEVLQGVTDSLRSRKEVKSKIDYSTNLDVLTDYYYSHVRSLSDVSRNYLLRRGLTLEDIQVYGINEGVNLYRKYLTINNKTYGGIDYSGRVLVPSTYAGKISFYVARDYTGLKDRKYLNPPSELAYSSEDVWNLSLAKQVSRTVIICEGVFTAIAAGRGKYNAVATYGKSISEISNSMTNCTSQGDKLLSAGFDTYIVAYDADATKELLDTCDYLSKRGAHVKFIVVPPLKGPHTDVSDLTREQYLDLLVHAEEYTPSSRLDLICRTSL